MKQLGLSIPLFIKRPKVTRRQKFLEGMEQVIPWAEWTNRIAPHYPVAGLGRKPFELEAMLRIHMMQQWFDYSDPGRLIHRCVVSCALFSPGQISTVMGDQFSTGINKEDQNAL
jgi:hypothetical protein